MTTLTAAIILGTSSAVLLAESLRLRRELAKSREQSRELEDIAYTLSESFDVGAITRHALAAAGRVGNVRRFELFLFDETDHVREVWATSTESAAKALAIRADHPAVRQSFELARLDELTGLDTSKSLAPRDLIVRQRYASTFRLPLYSGSRLIGHWELSFQDPLGEAAFNRLRLVYRHVTDALAAERNFRLAARDGLSDLFVRRFFDARLGEEISRSHRYHRPLALAVFDLDHFKQLNDTHGHAAGDEAIRSFGSLLGANLRSNDLGGRRGGEEFGVLFPETTAAIALEVCERIRRELADRRIEFAGVRLPLTVSGGLAGLRPGEGQPALLERADRALYKAKSEGRNRVILAE